ncbi:MAG: geranylgeranylglyceryl/heptaprenylglyceryl phosphate synthase [Chitinophagales bacterium]
MEVDFKRKDKANVAVLIDPDKATIPSLQRLIDEGLSAGVDFFFVGGSLLIKDQFHSTIEILKSQQQIPVVIFPGNQMQVDVRADGLLFLSLLSGRNAEYLIGQQVAAAPGIRAANIKTIATAYLLIDGGRTSSTAYITQTQPIPADREDLAVATVLAAEMLGFQCIYLEAGSGALHPVSERMVASVKGQTHLPVLVGGGIRDGQTAAKIIKAGADTVVIGNVLERHPELVREICAAAKA